MSIRHESCAEGLRLEFCALSGFPPHPQRPRWTKQQRASHIVWLALCVSAARYWLSGRRPASSLAIEEWRLAGARVGLWRGRCGPWLRADGEAAALIARLDMREVALGRANVEVTEPAAHMLH